jgi:hypothetical protein
MSRLNNIGNGLIVNKLNLINIMILMSLISLRYLIRLNELIDRLKDVVSKKWWELLESVRYEILQIVYIGDIYRWLLLNKMWNLIRKLRKWREGRYRKKR